MEQGPYIERREVAVASGGTSEQLPPPVGAVVTERVVAAPVVAEAQRVRTDAVSRFAPDAVISAAVGLALLLLGLIAVTRAGIDSPLSDPVVSVAGFRHTAVLGFIEVGFGLALLLSGAMRSRGSAVFFGALLGIASFVAAVQTSSFDTSLAIESSLAWMGVIAGAVVAIAALALPRTARRTTTVAGY